MSMKVAVVLAALLGAGLQTAQAQEQPDVKHVVSVAIDPSACGITDAVMTYEDAQGVRKTLTYKTWAYNCPQDQ
jgi:hypothetical protein